MLTFFRAALHTVLYTDRIVRYIQVERSLLHSLLRMFHDLGMYVDAFEAPFLRTTREFYTAEAAMQLQSMDIPSYLAHVRERLTDEEGRIVHYLHISTRKALLQTTLQTLLASHVDAIIEKGFTNLMDQSRLDELSCMYTLFGLVDAHPRLRQVRVDVTISTRRPN